MIPNACAHLVCVHGLVLLHQTPLLAGQVCIVAPPAPLLQKLLPYPALRTLAAHLMRFKRPPVKPQTALVKVFRMTPT